MSSLRKFLSLSINEEENKKLEELRNLKVKIIDIFRRGLEVIYQEKMQEKTIEKN